MKLNKSKKGISLIVLVITIMVMIILATAIILSLNSSNIVEKAKEAKTASDMANAKNVVILAKGEWELMTSSERANYDNFAEYAESKLQSAGYDTSSTEGALSIGDDGTIYKYPKIPEGFVASSVSTEDEVSEGLVIYEGTEPVTDANVATAQTTRNQYVWVPVEDEFERVNWENSTTFATSYTEPATLVCSNYDYDQWQCVDTLTLSVSNDLTGEYAEYAAMKASVAKYDGFYIARYEAGTTEKRGYTSGTAVFIPSQKNKVVYNFVCWGQSMIDVEGDVAENEFGSNQGKGAVELSRSIYPENANKEVVSTLIYGVQWDATLKFISKTDAGYALDSTDKGNYTGTLANTGSNNAYAKNNIYDMAGNVHEWTMETYANSTDRIYRGGDCDYYSHAGYNNPASYRLFVWPDCTTADFGFRIALYLK